MGEDQITVRSKVRFLDIFTELMLLLLHVTLVQNSFSYPERVVAGAAWRFPASCS